MYFVARENITYVQKMLVSKHQKNCVAQLNNQWLDVTCSQRKHYICSKDASK